MLKKLRQSVVLLIVLITLAAAYLYLKQFLSEKSTIKPRTVFENFNQENIESIEFTYHGNPTTIERVESSYIVKDQPPLPADKIFVDEILGVLRNLSLSEVASENKDKWTVYEVDNEQAIYLKVVITGRAEEIWLGKYGPDYQSTYLRIGDNQKTYLAHGNIRSAFLREEYRDLTIVDINPLDVSEIAFDYQNNGFGIYKEDGSWKGAKHIDFNLDKNKIESLLSKLSPLKGNSIVTEKPVNTGFGSPYLRLKISDTKKNTIELIIGSKNEEGNYFIKTINSQNIYTLPNYQLEDLPKNINDLSKS